MSKKNGANALVIVSDLHSGCKMGLCPPYPQQLIDGGCYHPSKFQKKVWCWWEEFWGEFVPRACRGIPYSVCINGETVDGVHHGSTTPISHNLEDQKNISVNILKPIVENCEGRFYVVSGTSAHSGQSGCDDESVAKQLGAVQDEAGRYARYVLWKRIGKSLINVMHTIGTTASQAYESTAVHKELIEAFVEAGRWHREPPDFVVRSHRHRLLFTGVPTHKGCAVSLVIPGWQGKTSYAHIIAGGRQAEPQFGGIVIIQGDEDTYFRHKVWSLDRPKIE